MGADTMQPLNSSNVNWHKSVYANDSFLLVKLCNSSAMELKLLINLNNYCKNPRDDYIFTVVGTCHSFKLYTFKSLNLPAFRCNIKAEECYTGA